MGPDWMKWCDDTSIIYMWVEWRTSYIIGWRWKFDYPIDDNIGVVDKEEHSHEIREYCLFSRDEIKWKTKNITLTEKFQNIIKKNYRDKLDTLNTQITWPLI
jgi:hypothetical protein